MTRLLLINPKTISHHPPLGLGHLSAYLRKHMGDEIAVRIHDEVAEDGLEETIASFRPDLVGIGVVTSAFNRVREIGRIVKKHGDIPVIVGGPHVTALPDSLLNTALDIAVLGEGEETLLELVKLHAAGQSMTRSEVKGIAYRQGERVIVNERRPLIANLDTVPSPDRKGFRMKEFYCRPGRIAHGLYGKATHMMASRGCPYDCSFCCSKLLWERKVRFFSPRHVVDEMESLRNDYRVNFVIFLDDNFTVREDWLEETCSLIRERGLHKEVAWDCESTANVLTPKKARMMKEAGCVRVEFGYESGSPRILKALKQKSAKVETNIESIKVCNEQKLRILGNFVIGWMDETIEEIEETRRFYIDHAIDYVALHLLTPYPGTAAWDECIKRGFISYQPGDRELLWQSFATGAESNNIIVNQTIPRDKLFSLFKGMIAEIDRRNNHNTEIFWNGLSLPEKARLFMKVARDRLAQNQRLRKIWHLLRSPATAF